MTECPLVISKSSVRCLIHNVRVTGKWRGIANWVLVRDVFGTGKTKALEICAWAEIDPYSIYNDTQKEAADAPISEAAE